MIGCTGNVCDSKYVVDVAVLLAWTRPGRASANHQSQFRDFSPPPLSCRGPIQAVRACLTVAATPLSRLDRFNSPSLCRMTVTKIALCFLAAAATTVAADSRINLRFSPLLIFSLVAATADAAYLRKAGQSQDSASDSRPESRRLDDGDCMDDPEWYHKNRGPDYDCAWVALKTDTRCAVNRAQPRDERGRRRRPSTNLRLRRDRCVRRGRRVDT